MAVTVQITEPSGETRRVLITGSTVVGRNIDGLHLADPSVSRRHARFELTDDDLLVVTDLESAYGTSIDGVRLQGPTVLRHSSVLALGQTTITLVPLASPAPRAPQPTAPPAGTTPPVPTGPAPGGASGVDPASASASASVPGQSQPSGPPPGSEGLVVIEGDGIEVGYLPGTAGERFARSTLAAARRARRRLAGFGTEAQGGRVRFYLVGPFPDPADPHQLVTQGTVTDPASAQVWMAVAPEAPPDPPERALAAVFAAPLAASGALSWLVEGYALHVGDVGDVDETLRGRPLPDLSEADDQLRVAMSLSFTTYLVQRGGDAAVRQVLAEATPETIDAAFQRHFGAPLRELGLAWRAGLADGAAGSGGSLGQFLRLSWRYLRPHRGRQVEIFFWMLVGLAFTVVLPFATRRLFDVVLPTGHMAEVLRLLGLLLAAFVLSLLAGLRRSYVSGFVSGALVRDLRNELFDRLQYLPTAWYRSTNQGDVLARLFSDVTLVEDGLSATLREGIFNLLSIVVTAVILLRLSPIMAVIVLVGTPLVAVVYRSMGSGARSRSMAVQERTGVLMNVAAENHTAEQVVKVYGLQARELSRFQAAGEDLFRRERALALFSGVFGLLVNSVVTLLRITVLAVGSWLVIRGRITLGTLVAFLGVMGELVGPVTTLTGIGQNLQAASGALSRINEILASPGAGADQGAPAAPLRRGIAFVGVGFGYGTGPRVLDEVDITVARGERVAVVGTSGSGKSTLLRLLMRLHDPDEGSILIDSNEVRQLSAASVRSRLGVVFQDSFLFDGTIGENVALGRPGADAQSIAEACHAAELDEVLASLPGGLAAPVGPGGANLSGGQRQRVAIARALVRDPDVLLLDEATSALDPQTERRLVETLERVSQGRTTIAITHRLGSVRTYDRIVVLDRGRVVEQGRHDELVAAGGHYSRLWAEQMGGPPAAQAVDLVAALRRLPFFGSVDDAVLSEVARRLTPLRLAAGASLGERADAAALIVAGRAVVRASGLGGPAEVAEIGPGDAFGLSAMLGDPAGVELVALEALELVDLERTVVDALARELPAVADGLRRGSGPFGPRAVTGARRVPRVTLVGQPRATRDEVVPS